MIKKIIPTLFILLFVNNILTAEEEMKAWKVKDLAEIPAEKIQLRDKRERVIKTLDINQMIYLYAIMTAIEEVAEINADLYIVPGETPNAFAGQGKNEENVVGINFAMLEMIGKDVHAAAAILGHELAHLKLNHGEDRKEAQKNTTNTSFTAAGTKYSRDNEREADYLGVIWAIEVGYDPEGAVRVHEQLYKISKRSTGSFVGSHPSSIERITILKSLVRRLSK